MPTSASAASAASCAPTWDEVNEIIAAANAYTAKTYGPDRVIGFSPIPAMSMVSYAAGSRYLSLLGGVCMSFYDWYCDLPPASPADLGRADRRAGKRRLVQFRLPDPVGLERAADAHARRAFLHRGPLQGRQERRDLPGLFRGLEVRRSLDARRSRAPTRRSRMAMGHVILREFHVDRQVPVFRRLRPPLHRHADAGAAGEAGRRTTCRSASLRASDFAERLGETNNPDWKTVAYDETSGEIVVPQRLGRLPLGREGQVEPRGEGRGRRRTSSCGCRSTDDQGRHRRGRLPLFRQPRARPLRRRPIIPSVLVRNVPAKTLQLERRRDAGRLGVRPVRRQLRRRPRLRRRATSPSPTTRTCPTRRPGRRRSPACRATRSSTVAREFARNAEKTNGRSMVILGAGDEPLVPHGHELPRHHQHAGDVRLRRPVRRRLVALCRPGKAAAADRLAAARLRARLEPPAAADELDLVLLRPHRPVALRDARRRRDPVADRAGGRRGTAR